ncbi:MAG: DUF5719 family protein [Acidimicrobiia bacterium]
MKRALVAFVAILTAVAAWSMPAPETAAGVVDDLPLPPTDARSGVWFCPGAAGEVDPILVAGVLEAGIVGFSLPADGDVLDSFQSRIEAGVGEWDVGDGLFFHPGPAIVETSSLPSAAAVLYRGPARVAADGCYVAAKEWFLNGSGIDRAETLTLRLFNPLLEQARVSLEVISEFGFEPLLDLESMTIGPRDWEDVSLNLLLGEREQVAVKVAVAEGVVIPGLHSAGPSGLAVWPGESPSSSWEFPVAQVPGTAGTLSVWNPGAEPAEVDLELMGEEGPLGRFNLSVGAGREERFDISTVSAGSVGAVLTSSRAVVAAVRTIGEAGVAGTVGAPRPSPRWLVPAHGIASDLGAFVYVLNSGDEQVELAVGPLGEEGGQTVSLPGHAIVRLEVQSRGVDILASGPVSVAWMVARPGDVGLGLGVPVTVGSP